MQRSSPDSLPIICIGSMLWDVIGRSPRRMQAGDDVAGRVYRIPGGVAMNIGMALVRQNLTPVMLSSISRDAPGDLLIAEAERMGLDTTHIWRESNLPTDTYLAVETPDGLMAAVADARALEAAGTNILAPLRNGPLGTADAPWPGTIVIDGNLTLNIITGLARDRCFSAAQLRIAPASPDKATRLWPLLNHPRAVFHLNLAEAEALVGRSFTDAAKAARAVLGMGAMRAIVTNGAHDAADARKGAAIITQTPPAVTAVRVTGAGDCFVAAHMAAELNGATPAEALDAAVNSAAAHVSG